MVGSKAAGKEKIEEAGLYVLSNQDNMYGAAKLLCKSTLEKISNGKNFYILPSSVHETILVLETSKIDKKELDKMVCEVNSAIVQMKRYYLIMRIFMTVGRDRYRYELHCKLLKLISLNPLIPPFLKAI